LCVVLMLFTGLFIGCKSSYKGLHEINGDVHCIEKFKPAFINDKYSTYVDVTKHHFSGILLFKMMHDSSMHVVFVNEVGVKFFEFSFLKDGGFIKHYALAKLDKKIVINALRSDIRLMLVHPDLSQAKMQEDGINKYVSVRDKSGYDHYITDKDCSKLVRIEKASKRKPVVVEELMDYQNGVPDSIHVQHKNFKFSIAMKHIEQ
jgi:hypothetical protein